MPNKLSAYHYALVAKYLVQNCGLRIKHIKAGYKISLHRTHRPDMGGRAIHFPPMTDKQAALTAAIDQLIEQEYIYVARDTVELAPYFWSMGSAS